MIHKTSSTLHRLIRPIVLASLMALTLVLPNPVTGTPNVSAAGGPNVQTANLSIIDYKTVILIFDAQIAPTYPTPSLFEVKADGVLIPATSVSVFSTIVDVTLASVVTAGQTLTISYLAPTPAVSNNTNAALQNSSGTDAPAFTDQPVTNTSNVSPLPTPGVPTVVAGQESATITVAALPGNQQPTFFRVYASPGRGRCDINAPSGSCTITGLIAGTAYTFRTVAFDSSNYATSSSPSTAPVTALEKTAAPVAAPTNSATTDTTAAPVTTPTDSTPATSTTASWDVEPATESEFDTNTEGFFPNPVPGNSIITNEFGFVIDKKGGIKPKIRMKSYAGRIAMTISAKYKVAGKTKNYKCTFKPFGTTKKVKSVKWRWYTPKKACILPKPLIAAVQKGETKISAKGKWNRQWLTSGKKARPNKSKIKPRTLKYTMRAKPAVVK